MIKFEINQKKTTKFTKIKQNLNLTNIMIKKSKKSKECNSN